MSVAKATCGGKTATSDADVQEQDPKGRSDWKPPREPVARGPARSVGIARGESGLLPTRYAGITSPIVGGSRVIPAKAGIQCL